MSKLSPEEFALLRGKMRQGSTRRWLRAADLQQWKLNGRFSEAHARMIANNLDPDLFGTIVVAHDRKTDTYTIIDGHHRIHAIVDILGWTDCVIECEVFEGIDDPEKAAIFLGRNKGKKKTPITEFLNAVEKGDDVAVAVAEILNKHAMRVTDSSTRSGISCPIALCKIYTNPGCYAHRGEALSATLDLIINTWGRDAQMPASVVEGIGTFLARYGKDMDVKRLSRNLASRHNSTQGVVGAARAWQDIRRRGVTIAACVSQVMVEHHNGGLAKKNWLPDWV